MCQQLAKYLHSLSLPAHLLGLWHMEIPRLGVKSEL